MQEVSQRMTGIGERIRERRLELGLSQRETAGNGVSNSYVSRIEVGTRNPSVRALREIASKLGVSVEWLETGVEPTRFGRFEPAELRLLEQALRQLDGTDGLLAELRRERARPLDATGPQLVADVG
jgi:transcriptional regulator with XRE-family HTH domain